MPSRNPAEDIYRQALSQQQQMYNTVQSGYAQLRNQLQNEQQRTVAGYNQLGENVQGLIGNIGRAQSQRIADQYTAASGQAAQDLTNRGLGNTTVSSQVNRGLAFDKAKADIELQDAIAQTQANYMTNIGLAGLGYRGAAAQQLGALGAQGYSTLAGFAPTAAGLYSGMASAAMQQQNLDYQRGQDALNRIFAGEQAGRSASQASLQGARGEAAQNASNAYRNSALAMQGQQFDSQNMYRQMAANQAQDQFQQNLNYRYDIATRNYGLGAPSSYVNPNINTQSRYGQAAPTRSSSR